MATYSSTAFTNKLASPTHGLSGNVKTFYFEVTCAAAPSTADTINFGYVPPNFRLLFAILESTDMDTNASPTITINVGDSGSANRIFAASTVAQAGTLSSALAVGGAAYKYTDKTLITGVAANNAATGAAGTLYLTLIGVQEDAATS